MKTGLTEYSDTSSTIHLILDAGGAEAGVSLVTSNNSCALARVEGTAGNIQRWVEGNLGANCTGQTALLGPSGSASVTFLSQEEATAPSAPTGLTATPADGAVDLVWEAPLGLPPIVGYRVYVDAALSTTVVGTSSTVSGLTNGQSYNFTVLAYNVYGESPQSSVESATPQPAITAPDAPTALMAVAAPGSASLSWSAPANPGSSPVSDYEVTVTPNTGVTGGDVRLVGSPTTSLAFGGLTDETVYTFTVKAISDDGTSPASDSTTVTPSSFSTIPGQVAGNVSIMRWNTNRIDVFAKGTDNSLVHNWSHDGGLTWSATWENMGGTLSGPVASSTLATAGQIAVFASGSSGNIIHAKYYTPGSGWASFVQIGTLPTGVTAEAMSASSRSGTTFELAVRASDDHVYRFYGSNTSYARTDHDCCIVAGSLGAVWTSTNDLEISGVGGDGTAAWRRNWHTGVWGNWTKFTNNATQVAATSTQSNKVTHFTRTTANELSQATVTVNTAVVETLSSTGVKMPAGGSFGGISATWDPTPQKLHVATTDADGRVRVIQRSP